MRVCLRVCVSLDRFLNLRDLIFYVSVSICLGVSLCRLLIGGLSAKTDKEM